MVAKAHGGAVSKSVIIGPYPSDIAMVGKKKVNWKQSVISQKLRSGSALYRHAHHESQVDDGQGPHFDV